MLVLTFTVVLQCRHIVDIKQKQINIHHTTSHPSCSAEIDWVTCIKWTLKNWRINKWRYFNNAQKKNQKNDFLENMETRRILSSEWCMAIRSGAGGGHKGITSPIAGDQNRRRQWKKGCVVWPAWLSPPHLTSVTTWMSWTHCIPGPPIHQLWLIHVITECYGVKPHLPPLFVSIIYFFVGFFEGV